ncbi:hypothetical protein EOL96_07490 [Candidatus Saccharibacteria bacterium]|nr:hypothetical protein [Candidatus Saccharibacteria bacterium]
MIDKQTAVHKRQKIQDSNKTMFLWIAGASVAVGFAAVLCWFLWQQTMFKMQVAAAKEDTANVLKANNKAIVELREDILILQKNPALLSSRTSTEENAVQVVLDALPADPNPLALGASLQEKILEDKELDGLKLESLKVDSMDEEDAESGGQITFNLSVSASDPNTLTKLLARFERSIRVINIETLRVNRSTGNYQMSIKAYAYYEPEKTLTLEEKSLQ